MAWRRMKVSGADKDYLCNKAGVLNDRYEVPSKTLAGKKDGIWAPRVSGDSVTKPL